MNVNLIIYHQHGILSHNILQNIKSIRGSIIIDYNFFSKLEFMSPGIALNVIKKSSYKLKGYDKPK